MNSRELSVLLLMAGSSLVWAGEKGEKKETLERARAEYRQAVSAHGANSPEAMGARRNLRQSRHTFHNERRERQRHR